MSTAKHTIIRRCFDLSKRADAIRVATMRNQAGIPGQGDPLAACDMAARVAAEIRDELISMAKDGPAKAVPALVAACKALMKHFVGDRNAENCLGGAGEAADQARAALRQGEGETT